MGKLGIFWLVPDGAGFVLLSHVVALDQAEEYGDCLTCALSHYDAWESTKRGEPLLTPLTPATKRMIAAHEYEDWPRGRIVFEQTKKCFVVYADRQIFMHIALIDACFNLPEGTDWRTDAHYSRSLSFPGAFR
ncbi:MAG: hypothetical protein B7X48_13600 [Acidiphilium sp. 34-60-192]|nr:MAG: hypothetical protein B7X48_13600 [Acidiphilium sp. 34-60-192]